MSTQARCLSQAHFAAASETPIYTAPAGSRVIVDKVVAQSTAGGTLTLKIVPAGGIAAPSNLIYAKTFSAGDSYLFPEMVGNVLEPGDAISELAGVVSTVVLRISGRVVT